MTGGSLYPSGRRRILHEHIVVNAGTARNSTLKIRIDTDKYPDVSPDAAVHLVVAESSFQRHLIALGVWHELATDVPCPLPNKLRGRFMGRLMVSLSNEASRGKLAASCENLVIDTGDGPNVLTPLLNSYYSEDLTSYAWRWELENGHPQVAIAWQLRDYPEFRTSAYFRALVLPEIVRRILEWMCLEADPSEEGSPAEKWLNILSDGDEGQRDAFLSIRAEMHSEPGRGLDESARNFINRFVSNVCLTRNPMGELLAELERP